MGYKSQSDNLKDFTQEQKICLALKSILRELKLSHIHQWGAKSDPDYLNDIDPSTLKSFKDTFTYGKGWNWGSREEFIDMFGCGNTYHFKFTQFECDLLYNEFEIIYGINTVNEVLK